MKTTTKILLITLSLLLGFSIVLTVLIKINSEVILPIQGSGNVVTQERPIEDFNALIVAGNCRAFLYQGDSARLVITADDNLLEVIKITEKDGVLDLNQIRRVNKESTLELHLTFVELKEMKVSRGGRVTSDDVLSFDSIDLVVSSGANVSLQIKSKVSKISASSGSHASFSGVTAELDVKTSSGASLNGSDLEAEIVTVKTSSGASNKVWATSSLIAQASSGSSVIFSGNPTTRNINTSSGANVRSKN